MKTKLVLLMLSVTAFFSSCQQTNTSSTTSEKSMIKVTILYPNSDGKTFDMNYYSNTHMPMVSNLLGDSMKFYKIDKGISGRTANEPMPYLAIGYLYFDKLSDYQESFGPNAEKIVGDIPNYTNIQPILQISEVLK